MFSVVAILTECRVRAPLLRYVLKRANDLEATIVVSHGVGNDVDMFDRPIRHHEATLVIDGSGIRGRVTFADGRGSNSPTQ